VNGETKAAPPETSSATSSSEVIARNLNAWFNEDKRPDGRKITNQDVAKYVTRVTGDTCHRTWIAKLRGGKVTAPELVRLDAVAEFFGRTRADLVGVEDPVVPSHDLRRLTSVVERLEAHRVDLAQLASLEPEDVRLVGILVRRLANKRPSEPAPQGLWPDTGPRNHGSAGESCLERLLIRGSPRHDVIHEQPQGTVAGALGVEGR
jgi:hypothetical protein